MQGGKAKGTVKSVISHLLPGERRKEGQSDGWERSFSLPRHLLTVERAKRTGEGFFSLAIHKMQMHSGVLVDPMTGALKPFEGYQLLGWSKAIPSPELLCFLMHTDPCHATKRPGAFCMGKERSLLQREGMPAGPRGAPGGESRPLQPPLPRSRTSVGMHSKAEVRREKKTGVSQREFVEERGIRGRRVKQTWQCEARSSSCAHRTPQQEAAQHE